MYSCDSSPDISNAGVMDLITVELEIEADKTKKQVP